MVGRMDGAILPSIPGLTISVRRHQALEFFRLINSFGDIPVPMILLSAQLGFTDEFLEGNDSTDLCVHIALLL